MSSRAKIIRWLGLSLIGLALLATVSWLILGLARPGPVWLQGQVETKQIRVAAKVGGRIASIEVDEGDLVKAGQLLIVLDTPEVQARARQVDAQVDAARAMSDKAETGARGEQIRAAHLQWQAVESQARLADVSAERIERLFADGVVPAQRRDEVTAHAAAARSQADAARENYEITRDATRPEDLRAARAQLVQSESGREEVQITLDEGRQFSPVDGEISVKVVEPGEVVSPGAPLLIINCPDRSWLTLNLREDLLRRVQMGEELVGQVPALGYREVRFKIYYIAALADFATWRSSRDLGGFDLRTFEVRGRPAEPVDGLRPGMTVLIDERTLNNI